MLYSDAIIISISPDLENGMLLDMYRLCEKYFKQLNFDIWKAQLDSPSAVGNINVFKYILELMKFFNGND